jgi:hypothetical protein
MKLSQSSCFNGIQAQTQLTPSKILNSTNNRATHCFFQFAFKFLINSLPESQKLKDEAELNTIQLKTIYLFTVNIEDFLQEMNSLSYTGLFNAVLLALTWLLSNKQQSVRIHSLNLLENIYSSNISESDQKTGHDWSSCIKRMMKYRAELEADSEYIGRKCLNRMLEKSSTTSQIIEDFLQQPFEINDKMTKNQKQLFFYTYVYDSKFSTGLTFVQFKYCILDLIKHLKDELKLNLLNSVFNLFDILTVKEKPLMISAQLKDDIVQLIARDHFLTKNSSTYFVKNSTSFKRIIDEAKVNKSVRWCFIKSLENYSNHLSQFYSQLTKEIQLELIDFCFDCSLELEAGRKCLLSFNNLTADVFIHLLEVKAKIDYNNNTNDTSTTTNTKQMKIKQQKIASENKNKLENIDWTKLKSLLEIMQSRLINEDNSINSSDENNDDVVMSEQNEKKSELSSSAPLIPVLFHILSIVEKIICNNYNLVNKNDEGNDEDRLFNDYLQIMCLNSLLSVYRLNKGQRFV